jgi:cysteinyl-tRNA synthetase
MASFLLYDTMARKVEPFAPADGATVRLYTCGPTVYNYAHIGNFRTFLFEDLLRRTLALAGWRVEQAMNLTDVEDKIIAKALREGITISAVTAPMIEQFFKDRDYLKIQPAEHYPRATQYIPQMIALVQRLEERGLAYRADDGSVYFAIRRFPSYGKLSRLDTREIKIGARVSRDDYSKEDAQDFALWKAAKPEDEQTGAAWDSPWGRGRPGWHLECSAMAMSIFGPTLDLHCGGIDLIFPHHEDEIAQSEGSTGVVFARHWCHGEFLLMEGAKMAKRVGNVVTVADLQSEGVPAAAVRHLVYNTHYRQVLNLTDEGLEASRHAVMQFAELAERLDSPVPVSGTPAMAGAVTELQDSVRSALFDDLNSSQALAAAFKFVRVANADLDRKGGDRSAVDHAKRGLKFIEDTLGVVPAKRQMGLYPAGVATTAAVGQLAIAIVNDETADEAEVRSWVEGRLAERAAARAARDFAKSDAIRDELAKKGIQIADSGVGTSWKKVG